MEWNGIEWNGIEWNGMECIVLYGYFISFHFISFHFISFHLEVRCDASPKYWCRYGFIDDFDRLPLDDVLSVFSHDWVVCIPFFEVDVNVIVMHHAVLLFASEFIFRQGEFFWFDDHFF